MQQITQRDIESLRRRINLAGGPRSGPSDPPGPAPAGEPQHRLPEGRELAVAGEEQETALGPYFLQERFYPNSLCHGRFAIKRLQHLSAAWLAAVSGGRVPPVEPRRWAFLDAETTGLAGGAGTYAFLIGVGSVEEEGFRVRLFFMRDYDEEPAMLQALANCLRGYEALVTFNGKAFDAPLIETRYRLQWQPSPLGRLHHVDLLHAARRIWGERLPNCRLGTLEAEMLGFERRGDIPGALIPQRYFDYLRTGRGDGLRPVFHHNALDIVSLGCLGAVLLPAFADPERAALGHGQDLLGLARWLRQAGADGQALDLYRRAIQAGLPASGLFSSLWEAAQLERRTGNHIEKLRLLRSLARVGNAYRAAAFVELAKHYEHRERDYAQALELTRSAQKYAPSQQLSHRERRLLRKAQKAADAARPAPQSAGQAVA